MTDSDRSDRDRRRGSLLTLASRTARSGSDKTPAASGPADPLRTASLSASDRHHLARSRREALRSPLVSGLSRPVSEPEDSFGDANRELRDFFGRSDEDDRAESKAPPEAVKGPAMRKDGFEGDGAAAPVRDRPVAAAPAPAPDRPVAAATAVPAADRPETATAAAPRMVQREPLEDGYWRPLIDPMAVIGGVRRSGGIIAATTICGAIVGVMIALSTPKQYVAVSELLVDPRDIRVSERELTAGSLTSDATLAVVENQVRVLMSNSVLNKVVEKLSLDRDPEFNGEGGGQSLFPSLSKLRSLLSSGSGESAGSGRRYALAVEHLYRAVDAERGGRTFVISVRAKTESPDKSALIVNTLTEVFLQTYGSIQAETAGRASDELTGRLAELRKSLDAAERKVEAFKAENDLVDAQGRLISDDEIVKLNDQLGAARARTLELDAKAASAREVTVDAALAGNLPEQITSPVLTEIRSQYATLSQEANRASTRLGPRHPERVAIEAQLEAARSQIRQELRLVASSFQVELKRAVQLEQELAARLAQLKARQANISGELVTLRELERDATAKRAVYEAFLLRARETGEQRDLNTANMTVISKATPPLEPTGMSRSMRTILSTMLGFGAGIAIGAGRGAWAGLRSRRAPNAPSPLAPRPAGPAPRGRGGLPHADARTRAEADAALATDAADPSRAFAAVQFDDPRTEPPASSKPEPAAEAGPAEESTMHHVPMHPHWPIRSSLEDGRAEAPYAPFPRDTGGAAMQPQWPPAPHPQHGYAPYPQHHMQQHAPYAGQPMPGHAAPPYPAAYPPAPEMYAPQGYYPHPAAYQGPQPWAGPQAPWPQHQAGPGPAWPQQAQGWPQPAAAPEPAAPPAKPSAEEVRALADTAAIDEIRESLREFREALRELADSRTRRRFL